MYNDEIVYATMQKLALSAGLRIMDAFHAGVDVAYKSDGSPVTEADTLAETMILGGLARLGRNVQCVSEERVAAGHLPGELGREFFLVDALDGTREFVQRRPDFTVNIALIRDGRPVMGVVYAPARRELYSGWAGGATLATFAVDMRQLRSAAIEVRRRPPAVTIVTSHSRPSNAATDTFIARHGPAEVCPMGSSLKFGLIASGQADLYPCCGRTMEWDTAAGHAVLAAAGGRVVASDGAEIFYGKRNQLDGDFSNPWFIASGAPAAADPAAPGQQHHPG